MSSDPYAEIQRLVAQLPQSRESALARAREWVGSGQNDLALDLLRRVRARDSAMIVRIELARVLHHIGRTREGLAEVVSVVKEDSANVDGLLLLAELLSAVGERDRARKMLERARAMGAPEARVLRVEQKCFSNSTDEADRTEPGAGGYVAPRTAPNLEAGSPATPPPRRTLLGLPSQEPRRALPRISEGGFSALDAYQTGGASPDESLLQEMPDVIADGAFDNFLSQMGVPVAPAAPRRPAPATLAPDDPTTGIVVDDDLLMAADETAAIELPERAQNIAGPSDQTAMSPSVQVSPALTQPPADLDNLPTWDSPTANKPNRGAQWAMGRAAELDLPDSSVEVPGVSPSAPRPEPVTVAAKPSNALLAAAQPPPQAQPQSPNLQPAPQFGLPPSASPRLSAMPQANDTQAPASVGNKTLIAVFGLVIVVFGAIAVLGASGAAETSKSEDLIAEAQALEGADTFADYKAALEALDRAAATQPLLGVTFPGARGPKLRKQAAAEAAYVAALLEVEFGETVGLPAAERLLKVSASDPARQAAAGLVKLKAGDLAGALQAAEAGRKAFPGNPHFEELDVLTRIAANDAAGAVRAVAGLRGSKPERVADRFLVLRVDAMTGDRKAEAGLRELISQSPQHVRARVALAGLLGGTETGNAEASKILKEVLEGVTRTEISSLDAARANVALGDVMARSGEHERAEDRYRDALRTLGNRWDLYVPLLEYYLEQGRFEEVRQYLEKAEKAGASGAPLTLLHARYLLSVSQVEAAIQKLLVLPDQTPGRAWWLGVGYYDLLRPKDAAAAFAKAPKHDVPARAAELAMTVLSGDAKAEEAGYDLEKMVDGSADPNAFWAKTVYAIAAMKSADSRDKREKLQKVAIDAAANVLKLQPNNARAQFLLCEVYLLDRDGKRAEKACLEGRKLNASFASGALLLARLRRLQGQYKEAREIIEAGAKQRPEDVRFGLERARIALESHDLKAAQVEIDRWLGKGVAEFELNLLEGRLAFERGDYAKAAAYLQDAQAMPQGDGEATVFFGITLARLGRTEEAGPLLLNTLPHPTWSGWGWLYLGELRRLQGRYDDAFENFPKALREFKQQTGPRWRFSTLYAEWATTYAARYKWDHPRVAAMLETGRDDGDSDDPELNMVLARYYLNKKKPEADAAERHLNKVLNVAPYRCDAIAQWLALRGTDAKRKSEVEDLKKTHCTP